MYGQESSNGYINITCYYSMAHEKLDTPLLSERAGSLKVSSESDKSAGEWSSGGDNSQLNAHLMQQHHLHQVMALVVKPEPTVPGNSNTCYMFRIDIRITRITRMEATCSGDVPRLDSSNLS